MHNLRKNIRTFFKVVLKAIGCVVLLQMILVSVLKFVPVKTTSFIIIRSIEHRMKVGEKLNVHHKWVPYEQICPEMKVMAVFAEDRRFTEHHGFDFANIREAVQRNKSKGKIVWGGSTITQQTAKNIFLYPKRSYFRKILEAEYTILLELIWGKERILEVYLNSAEMGENIYGVESCAEIIFNKTAMTLTAEQCAQIAALLPYGGEKLRPSE